MNRITRVVLILLFILSISNADAQCVMCKAVAEDSASGGGIGRGLNSGIIYLMGIPYMLFAVLYFVFFRKKAIFKG